MTPGAYIVSNTLGGMVSGAVGASIGANAETHPALKGALVVGGISALIATIVVVATQPSRSLPASGSVSGYEVKFP